MRRRALSSAYAVAALLLLGPTLRFAFLGLAHFPVRAYLYLAALLVSYPTAGLSCVLGSWFASIALRQWAQPDQESVAELQAAEWTATGLGMLQGMFLWSHRAAPPDADPTFMVIFTLMIAAFLVVAIASRWLR